MCSGFLPLSGADAAMTSSAAACSGVGATPGSADDQCQQQPRPLNSAMMNAAPQVGS